MVGGRTSGRAGRNTYYDEPFSEHQFSTHEKLAADGAGVRAGAGITDVVRVVSGSAVGGGGGGISLRVRVDPGAVSEELLTGGGGSRDSVGLLWRGKFCGRGG